MNKLKTYIINLKERTDRKKEMKRILEEIGIKNYKFVNATNRKNSSIKEGLKKLKRKTSGLIVKPISQSISKRYNSNIYSKNEKINKKTRGIIANFLSHMRIWYKIGKEKGNTKGYSLILEDDAYPTEYFKENGELLNRIKKFDIPFVYLGDCFRTKYSHKFVDKKINKFLMKKSRRKNSLLPRYTECLHAYLVSNKFCSDFVKNIDQFFPIKNPSDNFIMEYFSKNKIPFYVVDKSLFNQNLDFGTDIQFTGDDKLNIKK